MTSESTPAVWFPSVLEYGGGTMHHAALRGDIEAIAKLAVDGTPVRFAGGTEPRARHKARLSLRYTTWASAARRLCMSPR